MSARRRVKTHTQPCDAAQARKRLADARAFLDLAELVDVGAPPESLGERSRGDDHRDALAVVAQVRPGGSEAAKARGRLLGIKNDAEYGLRPISRANRELAMRQARKLVTFAETVLER